MAACYLLAQRSGILTRSQISSVAAWECMYMWVSLNMKSPSHAL